ncbi:MAG: sugar ABC transporter ATP-binding protein [Treponema sp. GWB1_62_6]|nr:MAG: sugar ABC transporter ATP-binding protein [Treponema sp. GWC1_61_84]OHE71711.1 MAG: sugar ABC transporter ATP-binding protein [Treponema sp. GWB1_62_6]OHE73734.1 MAG: sugar ABC transporter ATP-binding protein [Treponema sp. RIFOXYC1_FULL_61_9]HCM28765.1 sugar ABC transporter ATP-binding protein [Treponema sp.]
MTRMKYTAVRVLTYGALCVGAAACLLPFLWQLRSSVMTMQEIFSYPPKWLPETPQWQNYRETFKVIPFGRYYINTIFLVVMNIIGAVISNTIIAFSLARLRFRGRSLMFALSIGTLMIPTSVTLIPTFIEWNWLGGLGTFLPLFVPAFFGNAFFIFMLVQFFRTIPFEFDEAAVVDGASYPRIIVSIILPMAKPVIAVLVIFTFLNTWNDFMGPLLYLNDSKMFTLALGLKSLLSGYNSYWHILMAAATMVVAPLIAVFFIAQKFFIEGLTMGGIKG